MQHLLPSPSNSDSDLSSATSDCSEPSCERKPSTMGVEHSTLQQPDSSVGNDKLLLAATDSAAAQHLEAALAQQLSTLRAFLSAEFKSLSSAVQQLQQDQRDTRQTLVSTTQRLRDDLHSLELGIESSHSPWKGGIFKQSSTFSSPPHIVSPKHPFATESAPVLPPFAMEQRDILVSSPRPPSDASSSPAQFPIIDIDNAISRYDFNSYLSHPGAGDWFSPASPNQVPVAPMWSPPVHIKHAGEDEIDHPSDVPTSSTKVESPVHLRVYPALDPNAGRLAQFVLGDGDDMRKSTDALFELNSDIGVSPGGRTSPMRITSPPPLIPMFSSSTSTIDVDMDAQDHLRSVVPVRTPDVPAPLLYDVQCTIYGEREPEKPVTDDITKEEEAVDPMDAVGVQDDIRVGTPPLLTIGTPEPFSLSPILALGTHDLSMSYTDPGYNTRHEDDDAVEEEIMSRLSSLRMSSDVQVGRPGRTPRSSIPASSVGSPVRSPLAPYPTMSPYHASYPSPSDYRVSIPGARSPRSRSRSPYTHEYTGPIIYQSGGSRASSPVAGTSEDEAHSLRSRSRSVTPEPYHHHRQRYASRSMTPSSPPTRQGSPIPYVTYGMDSVPTFGSDSVTERSFFETTTLTTSPQLYGGSDTGSDRSHGRVINVGEPVLEKTYYTDDAGEKDGETSRDIFDGDGKAARPESVALFENDPSARASPSIGTSTPKTNSSSMSSSILRFPLSIPSSPIQPSSLFGGLQAHDLNPSSRMAGSVYIPTYGGLPLDAAASPPTSIGRTQTEAEQSPTRLRRPRFPTDRSPASTAVPSTYATCEYIVNEACLRVDKLR